MQSAAAYLSANRPEVAEWVQVRGSPVVLRSPPDFAEDVRRRRAVDLDAAVQRAGGAGAQRVARLMSLRHVWASRGRQRALMSMRSPPDAAEQHRAENPSEQAALLADYLGKVFADDEAAVKRSLSHAFQQRPGRAEVQHTMSRLRENALGPDGVPYSAWQAGGSPAEDCIMDLLAAMM